MIEEINENEEEELQEPQVSKISEKFHDAFTMLTFDIFHLRFGVTLISTQRGSEKVSTMARRPPAIALVFQ